MRSIRIGIFCAALLSTQFAFAATEAEREADQMLEVMGLENSISQATKNMLDLQLQQNPNLIPYKKVLGDFLDKYMGWDNMKPELIKLYAEEFTAQELREIRAFYETDTGQKAIVLLPKLTAKGGQIGVNLVQAHIGELEQMIKAEAERMNK